MEMKVEHKGYTIPQVEENRWALVTQEPSADVLVVFPSKGAAIRWIDDYGLPQRPEKTPVDMSDT